jgi:hypothetical protein
MPDYRISRRMVGATEQKKDGKNCRLQHESNYVELCVVEGRMSLSKETVIVKRQGKNSLFWDVSPCGSCKNRSFVSLPCEGDTFLRNVGCYKTHTAPHTRRRHSS